MIQNTIEWFATALPGLIASGDDATYYAVYSQTHVNYGIEDDCDIAWCNSHGVPVHAMKRGGGCCVHAPGSIGVVDFRRRTEGNIESALLHDFRDWLVGRGIPAVIDNNDILIDNGKVASVATVVAGQDHGLYYTCAQFAVAQDMQVIQNVCLKPMSKTPAALQDYGITTDDVVAWLTGWFAKE